MELVSFPAASVVAEVRGQDTEEVVRVNTVHFVSREGERRLVDSFDGSVAKEFLVHQKLTVDELEDWNIFVAMAVPLVGMNHEMAVPLAGMNREMTKPSLQVEQRAEVVLTVLTLVD